MRRIEVTAFHLETAKTYSEERPYGDKVDRHYYVLTEAMRIALRENTGESFFITAKRGRAGWRSSYEPVPKEISIKPVLPRIHTPEQAMLADKRMFTIKKTHDMAHHKPFSFMLPFTVRRITKKK